MMRNAHLGRKIFNVKNGYTVVPDFLLIEEKCEINERFS